MFNFSKKLLVVTALSMGLSLASCSQNVKNNKEGEGGSTNNDDNTVPNGDDVTLDKVVIRSSSELSKLIYDSLGADLTLTSINGQRVDYTIYNADNFTGARSGNANNKDATVGFTTSYSLALAGLAKVVSDNYDAKLYANGVRNKCNDPKGSLAIMQTVMSLSSSADQVAGAKALEEACNENIKNGILSLIFNFSFAVKQTT